MAVPVAAIIKKVALSVGRDKNGLKFIAGLILGITVILFLPLAFILCVFNGEFTVDSNRLQEQVSTQLSAEDLAVLQTVEDTMCTIEEAMCSAGFPERVTEAQVLYTLALSKFASEDGFVDTLVSCFASNQSDAELIASVNRAFGTEIIHEDFTLVMRGIRAVAIDSSGYIDPASKNNLDLVQWAKEAEEDGWGYVWGTYGKVLDLQLLEEKLEQYPDELSKHEDYIRENWLGGRTADCAGLIKGYGWFDPETGEILYGTNGMPDVGSDKMYLDAAESGTIDTIPEIPGLAVWRAGHIGIYIGGGEVIHASSTMVGVIRSPLDGGDWTHWLKIPYINYIEETEEVIVEESEFWH